jgi:hypothetical protein
VRDADAGFDVGFALAGARYRAIDKVRVPPIGIGIGIRQMRHDGDRVDLRQAVQRCQAVLNASGLKPRRFMPLLSFK